MSAPNLSTWWGRQIVSELAAGGLERAVVAPGSRSTPLTAAFARSDAVAVDTHLDERSAGFYALGYGKRSGEPAAVVSTSGTGAVNVHPAVVEAHQSRTPLVVLTADRPPELQDSGANQTIDQVDLYGNAARYTRTLPLPDADERTRRSLRTTVARALAAAGPPNPGPVHLDVPLRKPLAPTEAPEERAAIAELEPVADREPAVRTHAGVVTPGADAVETIRETITGETRGLIVAGPLAPVPERGLALRRLASATGFPLLADPLSNVRFGPAEDAVVLGGYDGFLGTTDTEDWPDPELVLRFGASPTSKVLREYLRDRKPRQFLVDPAGGWREATFVATDRVEASIQPLVEALLPVETSVPTAWVDRFQRAEGAHWKAVEDTEEPGWEGGVLRDVLAGAPDPSTLFVSNSMPVRDLDRFGRPREARVTVLGNRGASGIDGITSTALGAGRATAEPLIAVTGDLAYFHDMNGLVALGRFGLDATIVVVNNDGGGIFHMLPISGFDPPFEEQFVTPHGLDFSATEALYDLSFERVKPEAVKQKVAESAGQPGTQVLEVRTDAERSHAVRTRFRGTGGERG
ncbi:MAG: 2-succinyl-5-enolpyruvyl-6-hydroxy-3-cyclohexene-1-carboxylic-acid synthase [Halodesulfurarchaeum sp.]